MKFLRYLYRAVFGPRSVRSLNAGLESLIDDANHTAKAHRDHATTLRRLAYLNEVEAQKASQVVSQLTASS